MARRRRPGPLYDLFGEIPVSLDELLAWMLAVPGIPPDSPRFGHYVRGYQVIGKIQAAKLAGTFDQIVSEPDTPAPIRLQAAKSFTPWALAAVRRPPSSVAIGRPSTFARSKYTAS